MEALPLDVITHALTQAIQIDAAGFDAVKLIALAYIERRPARFDLTAYPRPEHEAVNGASFALDHDLGFDGSFEPMGIVVWSARTL